MSRIDLPILEVAEVGQRFARRLRSSLRYGLIDAFRDISGLPPRSGTGTDEFWAVDNVSFALRRGESLGLIGVNGAGKSTLLKMIAGLLKPDRGSIRIRGRVGALIELGAGMHPLLTGRENIRVNAAILGLTRREISARLDEIIAFADLGSFIDSPVQNYSTGMRMRLGFAVAAHTDPDLLLIDEVLAVGDAGFRRKCYERLSLLRDRCAIVIVSHHAAHLARLCSRGLLLNAGQVITDGAIAGTLVQYQNLSLRRGEDHRVGSGKVRLQTIEIQSGRKEVPFGDPLEIRLSLVSEIAEAVVVDIAFRGDEAHAVAECGNYVIKTPIVLQQGLQQVTAHIASFTLNPGKYFVCLYITSPDMLKHHEWFDYCAEFSVTGTPSTAAQQFIATWKVKHGTSGTQAQQSPDA